MNWVRLGSAGAALGVHMAALGLFVLSAVHEPDLSALQSGSGEDDLTIVATITMQSEESLGLDAASVQRQEASLGGQAAPEVQEEVKKEEEKKSSFHPRKRRILSHWWKKRSPKRRSSSRSPRPPRPPAKLRKTSAPPRALSKHAGTRCCRSTTVGSIRL